MSDQADPFAGSDDDTPVIRALRQQNRELADAVKELRGEVAKMSRSSVFDDLGVPRDGAGAFFREKYDGELSREAVEAAARQYGILAAPPPATPPEEQAAFDRIFDQSSTPPVAEPSAANALLEQLKNAADNDAIEALLDRKGLMIYE